MTLKDQVIQARFNGESYNTIFIKYGVAKSTARDWVVKHEVGSEPIPYVNDNIRIPKPKKAEKNLENIFEFIEQLAPISNPVKRNESNVKCSEYALVIGDLHFPMHCQKTIDVFFETIDQLNPKTIILNGDTLDLLSVSRYPKDIRHNYNLLDERKAYHSFLSTLLEVSNGADIIETQANHSGNSTEGRWWRYLSEKIGELSSLPDIKDILSYEKVFMGEYADVVDLVDYVEVIPDFIVTHGDIVRSKGGASARGMLDKLFTSVLHNHTHRFGMTAQRIPSIGTRPEKQLYGWENGCACSLDPIYASSPNWQQGFSIIGLDKDAFSVEQVMVNNGVANVATLGCTIKS